MSVVLLDDARAQKARLYQAHVRREYLAAAEVDALDGCLARGWREGLHACVRIPYAFGLALNGLHDDAPPLCLDWFASLEYLQGAEIGAWLLAQDDGAPAGLLGMTFEQDEAAHAQVIDAIHEHIRAGDVYQINHTLRAQGCYYGSPFAIYAALRARQAAPYAAFAHHPEDGYTLCLSPELFLKKEGNHLYTLPMKGTARAEGDIAAAKAVLQNDPKNRAENLMIVDLLRNDLSRIARPFGVSVSDAFHVEQYGQVLQMTSRVNALLRDGITHADMLRAAFPCGSITGAPKRMAMHLIERLESSPRGIYTGAIGYMDAQGFCLNVAIRTLTLQDGRATFGVGAGITIDSHAQDEFREYRLKSAFLHTPPAFSLFETLRVSCGEALHLDAHLMRLAGSAQASGIACDSAVIRKRAEARAAASQGMQRMKITLHPDGQCDIALSPLTALPDTPVRLLVHPHVLPVHDALRRHKTTHRAFFDSAWQQAEAQGAFDSLIFNTNGDLLEGGRSSVFVRIDGQWHTPASGLDILPGIARAQILGCPQLLQTAHIQESRISRAMLERAEEIVVCNSLRGILPAVLA